MSIIVKISLIRWRAKLCPLITVSWTWDEPSLKFKVHKKRTYLASGDSNSGLEGLKGQLAWSRREGWRAKLCQFSTVSYCRRTGEFLLNFFLVLFLCYSYWSISVLTKFGHFFITQPIADLKVGEKGWNLILNTVKNHVPPDQPNPLKMNLPPSLLVTLSDRFSLNISISIVLLLLHD